MLKNRKSISIVGVLSLLLLAITAPAFSAAPKKQLTAPKSISVSFPNDTNFDNVRVTWLNVTNNNGYTVKIYRSPNLTKPFRTAQIPQNMVATTFSLAYNSEYRVTVQTLGTGSFSNSPESGKYSFNTNLKAVITTQPSGAVNGTALTQQPFVKIVYPGGNTVTGFTGNVVASIASGTGTLTGTTTKAAVAGIATFDDLVITGTAGNFTLTFTPADNTITPVTSVPFALTAGAATTIAINAGDAQSATAGSAVSTAPSVIVKDANNNPVSGVSVTFAVATGGGSLATSGTVTTGVDGIATSPAWTLGTTAGSNTLSATSGSLSGSPATFTATATAGAAASSVITTQPTGAVSGATLTTQPIVKIVDANGNTVTGFTGNVVASIASGTGTLTGTTTKAAVAGIATFTNLVISGTAGNFTLTFTPADNTITPVTSVPFALTAGAATTIAINAGDAQSATAGSAVSTAPSVIVKDANNNPVSGVSVTFAVATGGGSLATSGTVTTGVDGIATSPAWTLGTTAGSNTLSATSGSLSGSPATFTATATAGAAASSVITTQPTGAVSGATLTTQPIVKIVDANGNTVTGFTGNVVASIASGTGTLTGTTTKAAVAGIATFTNLVISGTAGNFTLTFTPADNTITPVTSVPFALTAGASSSLITNGQFTIRFWVKPTTGFLNGQRKELVSLVTDNGTSRFDIWYSPAEGSDWGMYNNQTSPSFLTGFNDLDSPLPVIGNWYEVVVTRDASNKLHFYFGSVESSYQPMSTVDLTGYKNLLIGADPAIWLNPSASGQGDAFISNLQIIDGIALTPASAFSSSTPGTTFMLKDFIGTNNSLVLTPTSYFAYSNGALNPRPTGNAPLYSTELPVLSVIWDDQSATTASSGGSSVYTIAAAVATIPTVAPIKTGFSFGGWFTQTAGAGTQVTNGSYTPASPYGAVTFYAQWSAVSSSYAIGDTGPGGGTIFYYSAAGFNCGVGFTSTGSPTGGLCHYLEVAPDGWRGSAGDPTKVWAVPAEQSNDVSGINDETVEYNNALGIGLGYKNSDLIVTQNGAYSESTNNYAAGAARAYAGGSKSDWYLPTTAELNLLCQWNRGVAPSVATACTGGSINSSTYGASLAGFVEYFYWSSSEYNANFVWFQYFYDGYQYNDNKSVGVYVRPVRAF